MAMLQGLSLSMRLTMGTSMPRTARARPTNPLWNHYRCQDDQWIALAMLQSDRYWAAFCAALGRPGLGQDERYASVLGRARHAAEIVAVFDEVFASRPRAEWLAHLAASPGDFIFTVVNSVDDLPDDPQVQANGYVTDFEHPQFGKTRVMGLPVRLSETPGSVRLPAPELGQHTEEILLDVLGCDWERISALRDREVI
jgi:crotonobetainyl-CoA:carnitine CoA-transferase CaiB-like acyl-CoA transferase